ncbi:MAG: hypothetical protein LIP12_05505 [Clostridiales bacterium]|nr:hypothetical protein [Clostridiales bacterium]MCC8065643.1 hypothetical protein [Clostridiales bacterium]
MGSEQWLAVIPGWLADGRSEAAAGVADSESKKVIITKKYKLKTKNQTKNDF